MTQDDVLFGYRLQVFDLASRTTVAHACRSSGFTDRPTTGGSGSSTVRGWRCCARVSVGDRSCPTSSRRSSNSGSWRSRWVIPVWAAAHLRAARAPGVGRAVGQSQRRLQDAVPPRLEHARQAAVADRRLPRAYEPHRDPDPELHLDTSRPGELVGVDCFYVGRLHGTAGTVWQITAIDTYSGYAWADLVTAPNDGPGAEHTSRLARRVAAELQAAGWRLERVLFDNGNEFRSRRFTDTLTALDVRHTRIRAGRPQTNGHVERLHRTILEECWRPVVARFLQVRFTGVRRELARYLDYYNRHRAHTGRTTAGRCPADLVYGARKMEPR